MGILPNWIAPAKGVPNIEMYEIGTNEMKLPKDQDDEEKYCSKRSYKLWVILYPGERNRSDLINRQNASCGPTNGSLVLESQGHSIKPDSRIVQPGYGF